ncbi:MAG TPA: hydantoinase/oxoprolinase family protein [Trueperaceae bacterium]
MSDYRVAVDIGGTFTDVVLTDAAGSVINTSKVLTTPQDPAEGFLEGIARAIGSHAGTPDVSRIVHATTLVTNTIIQRHGARVALLMTEGFRDVLELGTETRYDLYDLHLPMPEPLVPRYLRAEVPERLDATGRVLRPLDLEAALAAARQVIEGHDVAAIAICLLHAHVNPVHEQALATALHACYPHLPVSLSSEIAPFVREYPRASTTAANAYVQPVVHTYLGSIRGRLAHEGFGQAEVYLMLSHGGLTNLEQGARVPIHLCESGPAAGVIAAAQFGMRAGATHIVSFDMGGTTAKMCMVLEGAPQIGRELEVAHESRFRTGSGLPLSIQSVQLMEIGAGGGSIARTDATGLLEVGPESAGAMPGPACYGRGGSQATVTDANLLLGHLPNDLLLGNHLPLDAAAAAQAFTVLGERIGTSALEAAQAVLDVVNEKMALAIRRYLVENGQEPAPFTLVATGGAGPLHACPVAGLLGIDRVIVPSAAGVGSALGLLMSRFVVERNLTQRMQLAHATSEDLRTILTDLRQQAHQDCDPAFGRPYHARYFVDARYQGQGYELRVEVQPDATEDALQAQLASSFEASYRTRFGRSMPGWPIEVLSFTVRLESPQPTAGVQEHHASDAPATRGRTWQGGAWRSVPVWSWQALSFAVAHHGPMIVTDPNTTIWVPDGWQLQRQPSHLELLRTQEGR